MNLNFAVPAIIKADVKGHGIQSKSISALATRGFGILCIFVSCDLASAQNLDEWTLNNIEPDSHGMTALTLLSFASSPERAVAVGSSGTILSSTNGVDWVAADAAGSSVLNNI